MTKQTDPDPAQYIIPLNMNGLKGRMLRLPSAKPKRNRELLVVYGHHAKLERWWGLIQNFADYGHVTMPDLPGFGGMDSFYKIGQKPTIDNLADYLASFVKLRYKRRRFTVVGISFGFVIATRMLQRCPELAKKVDLVVSTVGFAHHSEFLFTKRRMLAYRAGSRLVSLPVVSNLFRLVALNPWVLRTAYVHTHNAKKKFAPMVGDPAAFNRVMEVEIDLWHINDVKTHMYTTWQLLKVDNTAKRVELPVCNIYTKGDYYFDNVTVEQHLRRIFKDYTGVEMDLRTHAPRVIATKAEAAEFVPPKVRRVLKQLAL